MGKSSSSDFRSCIVGGIERGHSCRAAPRRFGVAPSTVVRLAQRKAILKERGAWFFFLPRYSPNLNPIEMAFAN